MGKNAGVLLAKQLERMEPKKKELLLRRHPSRLFIRYLLSLGSGQHFGAEFVNSELASRGLYPVEKKSLEEERKWVDGHKHRPTPYLPTKKDSHQNTVYWEAMEVLDLHDGGADRASSLLRSPSLREDLETGLRGFVEPFRLVEVLTNRYGEEVLDAETIKLYGKYYYDTTCMTLHEWAAWLKTWGDEKALSVIRGGPTVALHRLGLVTTLENRVMLGHMRQELFFRLMEVSHMETTTDTVKMLTDLSKECRFIMRDMTDAGDTAKETVEKFGKFTMDNVEDEVVDIHALGGSFSESGIVGDG